MRLPRRQILQLAAGAAALPAISRFAGAQTYPMRPLKCIVAYPAGGPTDIFARLVGQSLSERLGQPFVIENKTGAGSNIATEAVLRAPADGYTLLGTDSAAAINASLYLNLSFNFMRDIAVLAIIRGPLVMMVHPSVPAGSIPEFIAYAKANPGKINMASAGTGNVSHVAGELLKELAHIDMTHVPYRGTAPVLPDLLGGQVQVYFGSLPATIEHIRAGRLRALAVTSSTRSASLPDVPTVGDFVAGYEASQWFMIGVRKITPAAIVDRLAEEIGTILADAKMEARFADLGTTVFAGSLADLGGFVAAETGKWGKVIRAANIKLE
jgi:tripartite-type tricarboxylate transporter receptor subunit TctC